MFEIITESEARKRPGPSTADAYQRGYDDRVACRANINPYPHAWSSARIAWQQGYDECDREL